jgi:hypothetical protein
LSAKSFVQTRLGIEIDAYLIELNGVYHINEVLVANQPSKAMLAQENNPQKYELFF